jgi:hypothetical protein
MKLVISTVLNALSGRNVEIVRLCRVAMERIEGGVVVEWTGLRGSGQLGGKLKEKGGVVKGEMLLAVGVR